MKVVAFNGSPKKEGNTRLALGIVAEELEKSGIETEIVQVGSHVIRGCMACGACGRNRNEQCVFGEDGVNDWIQKMKEADGILLGTPVHYASVGATLKAFLDRAFYVAGKNGGLFRHKVGAGIAVVRRSGGLTAFNQLNHYLQYAEMIIPTSNYWSVIHGTVPGDVLKDEEGVQIMRVLGRNMAWALKLVEHGKTGVDEPDGSDKIYMNFIR